MYVCMQRKCFGGPCNGVFNQGARKEHAALITLLSAGAQQVVSQSVWNVAHAKVGEQIQCHAEYPTAFLFRKRFVYPANLPGRAGRKSRFLRSFDVFATASLSFGRIAVHQGLSTRSRRGRHSFTNQSSVLRNLGPFHWVRSAWLSNVSQDFGRTRAALLSAKAARRARASGCVFTTPATTASA